MGQANGILLGDAQHYPANGSVAFEGHVWNELRGGAVAILDRSQDKGVYKDTVQWDTFRQLMSAITNMSQAAVGGLQNAVGAYKRMRLWILDSLTHKFWFSRFMTGMHKQAGHICKPNKEVTIDFIHAINWVLELEWQNAQRTDERKRIVEMGT